MPAALRGLILQLDLILNQKSGTLTFSKTTKEELIFISYMVPFVGLVYEIKIIFDVPWNL